MNEFDDWNNLKQHIHSKGKLQTLRKSEIWWVSVGMNIGQEIFGKGKKFARPVLVINAEHQANFVGIPLTSKKKSGKYSCIIKTIDEKFHTALIQQIRTFDKRRAISKAYDLEKSEYMKVQALYHKLFKV